VIDDDQGDRPSRAARLVAMVRRLRQLDRLLHEQPRASPAFEAISKEIAVASRRIKNTADEIDGEPR
jgi:hypothetical protein